ncbi:TetR/AcrR family transcriptional regulator [Saccharibacillus endophyticus]|uniref:TetR family transcriptional regulator n=1 Tax=Saccharibacillus endophyticus TaxID=2060666 RepID=A0ABQ1ZPU6_9BACL|nr:TetR/AcrR family transcriptional regulator [Saccharibacillus endophyticus]GGH70513.1 TetR family transcriptional regulator [Saccharibacillus endophyticus]
MDRRVRKTRETLFDTFIELLREKGFERITIQEIADRADVNRGTVYLHFQDKFDLLNQCIDSYLHDLNESCRPEVPEERPEASLLRTFEYLEQSAELYSLLVRSEGNPAFRSRLSSMLKQGVGTQFDRFVQHDRMNKEIAVQFLTTAIVGLFEWWLAEGMPYSPAEMVRQLMILLEAHGLPGPVAGSERVLLSPSIH